MNHSLFLPPHLRGLAPATLALLLNLVTVDAEALLREGADMMHGGDVRKIQPPAISLAQNTAHHPPGTLC